MSQARVSSTASASKRLIHDVGRVAEMGQFHDTYHSLALCQSDIFEMLNGRSVSRLEYTTVLL